MDEKPAQQITSHEEEHLQRRTQAYQAAPSFTIVRQRAAGHSGIPPPGFESADKKAPFESASKKAPFESAAKKAPLESAPKDGNFEVRTWKYVSTSKNKCNIIRGSFVSASNTVVRIRNAVGVTLAIPRTSFYQADQVWLDRVGAVEWPVEVSRDNDVGVGVEETAAARLQEYLTLMEGLQNAYLALQLREEKTLLRMLSSPSEGQENQNGK